MPPITSTYVAVSLHGSPAPHSLMPPLGDECLFRTLTRAALASVAVREAEEQKEAAPGRDRAAWDVLAMGRSAPLASVTYPRSAEVLPPHVAPAIFGWLTHEVAGSSRPSHPDKSSTDVFEMRSTTLRTRRR
jgi:hypothetical protein